jgi:hypothetical protein
MPTYLVEAYSPRLTRETCCELEARARQAAHELAAEGRRITYLSSIFIREDETCFHLFEAVSANDVEAVTARAALPLTRIVETVR